MLDEDHVVAVHQRPTAVRALLIRGRQVVLERSRSPGGRHLVDPAVGVEEPLAGLEVDARVPLDPPESPVVGLQLEGDLACPGLGSGADSVPNLGERDPGEPDSRVWLPTTSSAESRGSVVKPRWTASARSARTGSRRRIRRAASRTARSRGAHGKPSRMIGGGGRWVRSRTTSPSSLRRLPCGTRTRMVASSGSFVSPYRRHATAPLRTASSPGEPERSVEPLVLGRLAGHQPDLAAKTLYPEPDPVRPAMVPERDAQLVEFGPSDVAVRGGVADRTPIDLRSFRHVVMTPPELVWIHARSRGEDPVALIGRRFPSRRE